MPSVSTAARTPYAVLLAAARRDGSRPLVTWYDDATGARTELSVASTLNAVAKTANLLRDGLGLAPGATVGVCLPLHWQHCVWLGAIWALGAVVVPIPEPGSDRARVAGGTDPSAAFTTVDLAVVAPSLVDLAAPVAETVAVSLDPLGLPERPSPPPPVLDHATEVRLHGDSFVPAPWPSPRDPAVRWPGGAVWSQEDVLAQAREAATRVGLADGGRLLTVADPAWPDGLLALLAVPLVVGGSVLVVAHEDVARREARVESERVTGVLAPAGGR